MESYNNIPSEMKQLKRWVLWKTKNTENGKTTKIPINAKNGYGAKSNDSSTWVSFNEAISKVSFYNCKGLGFMLGDGYFGVDIDNAIEDTELINEFVKKLNSYTEISQSGKGIHIICKGVLPQGARRKGNIEMYDNARFFAMTGNLYQGTESKVEDRTDEVKQLWNKYLNDKKEVPSGAYVYTAERKPFINSSPSTLNDNEVIDKIKESQSSNLFNCLYYGQWEGLYPSQSEADMAMCSILAFWCAKDESQIDRIFRSSKLYREKWDLKRGANTYGEMTIRSAVNGCRDVYTPAFNSSVQSYNPKTGEVVQKKKYDLTDTGNAQRFIDRFGQNLRYNHDNKYWMIWDGKTWIIDNKQIVKTQVDILIEEMKVEAVKEKDDSYQKELFRNIKHLSNNGGKEAMLKEAMHIGIIPARNCDFDKAKYLLNCFNGVVDLEKGIIIPHNRDFLMSKNTHLTCDFNEEPKRWVKFLYEIFDDDEEMVEFIQRAIGYTLTGDTNEHFFFQCFGDGANGKSVFLDIIYKMLGDYSLNAQVECLLAKGNGSSGGANTEIARMNGARFVRTNEPNEGSRFNEGLVKQLVAGDVTTARFLYGKEFEFKPNLKLWIATNYKIGVRGTDNGIWRRNLLIPFLKKFDENTADKYLTEKLMNELPQILGWSVKGAMKWKKEGIKIPTKIKQASAEYKKEMDIVSLFLDNCTKISANGREKASDVFKEYVSWAKSSNEWSGMTQSKFGIEMGKKFQKKNINGYVYYVGFILKKNDESYVYESRYV